MSIFSDLVFRSKFLKSRGWPLYTSWRPWADSPLFVSAKVYLQMRCILEEKLMLPIAVNVEVNISERVPAQLSNTQVASTYLNAPHGGSNLTATRYTWKLRVVMNRVE